MSIQTIDPRQQIALNFYKDPSSETFSDLKNSLIKAGYSSKYANSIYNRKVSWLTENTRATVETIQKAESNLQKIINKEFDLETETKATIEKLKMQLEASKFILKTLAKQKYAEEKAEEKANTTINIIKYGDRVAEAEVVKEAELDNGIE
jgi:hypothetical protein